MKFKRDLQTPACLKAYLSKILNKASKNKLDLVIIAK